MSLFVKQKTAYEMSRSDWSSDVCSSDLRFPLTIRDRQTVMFMTNSNDKSGELLGRERRRRWSPEQKLTMVRESLEPGQSVRSEERRVGKECVSTRSTRW